MTEFPDMWPYMFIIFSNAASLGASEQDRDKQLRDYLKQPRCPKSLIELVHKVNNRYILVESMQKASDPEAYYKAKVQEVHGMITKLDEANNHLLYTNVLFRRAKEVIDKLIKEKMEAEKALHSIKKRLKLMPKKEKKIRKLQKKLRRKQRKL